MKTENQQLGVFRIADLKHAPWNPRTPEELSPEHPAMVELIASVRAVGVIQPIAVWVDSPSGEPLVIAGNRRMEASRAAGRTEIPAHIFTGLTEAQACEITRIENECRFGVTPLADAALIAKMRELGRSQSEMAALFGVSEARICRRAKLLDLSEKVRAAIEGYESCVNAKSLEMIASYPAELQNRAAKEIHAMVVDGILRPGATSALFARITTTLRPDMFIFKGAEGEKQLAVCRTCGKCTGNQPTLFDDDLGENPNGDMGRCLDLACYKRVCKAARDRAIKEAVEATSGGVPADGIIVVHRYWEKPFVDLKAKKRGDGATFAYALYGDFSETVEVRWGPAPKVAEAQEKRRREDEESSRRAEVEAQKKRAPYLLAGSKKVCEYMVGGKKNDAKILLRRLKTLKSTVLAEELAALQMADGVFFCTGNCSCDVSASHLWAITHFPALRKKISAAEMEALSTELGNRA